MIGLPFVFWLIFTIFDFGNIDQVFAILGIIGIGLNLTKWRNKILITFISFILMLTPLTSRLVQVQLEKFNYLAFQIPFAIFCITYLIFIIINIKQKLRTTAVLRNLGGSD